MSKKGSKKVSRLSFFLAPVIKTFKINYNGRMKTNCCGYFLKTTSYYSLM